MTIIRWKLSNGSMLKRPILSAIVTDTHLNEIWHCIRMTPSAAVNCPASSPKWIWPHTVAYMKSKSVSDTRLRDGVPSMCGMCVNLRNKIITRKQSDPWLLHKCIQTLSLRFCSLSPVWPPPSSPWLSSAFHLSNPLDWRAEDPVALGRGAGREVN